MILRRRSVLAVFVLLAVLIPGTSVPVRAAAPRWVLTFHDEFAGHRLDTTKWTASRGTMDNHAHPVQYFLPDDVFVSHGHLTIRSEQRVVGGCGYTSGEISTLNKFAQCYGRFVVRCRFPSLPGTWSAAYLLPASGEWPPEIDISEFIGRSPDTVFLTNHWKEGGRHQQQNCNYVNGATDWTRWHIYEVDWTPGTVRWSIDGMTRGKAFAGVSSVPMYLRLNTAIGGAFADTPSPAGWPQTFQVDYVRVYRRLDQPEPVLGMTAAPLHPGAAVTSGVRTVYRPSEIVLPPSPSDMSVRWKVSDSWLLLALILFCGVTACTAPGRPRMTAGLATMVCATSVYYLLWRVSMIAWADWWVALPLFAAELFGIAQVLGFHYTIWPRPEPGFADAGEAGRRPIFILIPTVNEGRDVVEPTVRAALAARDEYLQTEPGGAVTIVVCNDGRAAGFPGWSEIEGLARELGVLCLTRTDGAGAKAGNLEHARQALGATGESLIALFDADMVAEPDFLLATIPPFRDPSVGWVQTGQYYRNVNNPVVRWAHDQQTVFFTTLCPGKARLGACFICGTNVVIRAAALDEIGGLPQDSVTEDFAASVILHAHWRSLYLPEVLATGLGPADLPAYFAQQRRWATGTLGVLRREWRRILLPGRDGLRPAQRVQYALSGTHYLSGLCGIVYFFAPLLYLFTGVPALRPFGLPDYFRHFIPFWLTSQLAFWYACGRRNHWRGAVLGFGSAPVLIAGLLAVLLQCRTRFVVTAKRRRPLRSWRFLLPHLCAFAAGFTGLAVSLGSGDPVGLVWISAIWVSYALIMLAALFGLAIADQGEAEEAASLSSTSGLPALADFMTRRRRQKQDDTTT